MRGFGKFNVLRKELIKKEWKIILQYLRKVYLNMKFFFFFFLNIQVNILFLCVFFNKFIYFNLNQFLYLQFITFLL